MAFVRKEDPESTRGFIVAAERDKPLRVFVLFYVCMAKVHRMWECECEHHPPSPITLVEGATNKGLDFLAAHLSDSWFDECWHLESRVASRTNRQEQMRAI